MERTASVEAVGDESSAYEGSNLLGRNRQQDVVEDRALKLVMKQ
jgi:hypothetical protein